MKKIIKSLFVIFLLMIGICYAQFELSGDYELIHKQYKSWLSTAEAPTNELNFSLKSKSEQEIYNTKNSEFVKTRDWAYDPDFYDEWQATDFAPINWSNFHLKSKEEQEVYMNLVNQWFEKSNKGFLVFNISTLREPFLIDAERKIEEAHIKRLLVQCAKAIGPELWEVELYEAINKWINGRDIDYDHYEDGPFPKQYYLMPTEATDMNFIIHISQPHKLDHYVYKCVNYLYLHQGFNPQNIHEYYNISDFEYDRNLSVKEKIVEKIYEEIYLSIKRVGLLRRIENIYYPKSFIREHADQTGLTEFIKAKEKIAGQKLNHDELAIQFFETREQWLTSLNDFIGEKLSH